ncbi:hypothetical protein PVAG01_08752 [Phlyctema vagabunda]|uniref:Uncharacterized protein n=1 Tax=Phlyctema vagabunda TaxID=108571 RepID=A0ABR4PAC2_9HELO
MSGEASNRSATRDKPSVNSPKSTGKTSPRLVKKEGVNPRGTSTPTALTSPIPIREEQKEVISTIQPTIKAKETDSPFRKAMVEALANLETQIAMRNQMKRPLPGISDQELEYKVQDVLALIKAHYQPQQSDQASVVEELEILAKFVGFLKQWAV